MIGIDFIKENKDINIINNVFLVHNNTIDSDYVGYLEVPKYNIKRLIKVGNTKSVLDSNYVLYYNSFRDLDKNNSNIVLLGHNIDTVFRFLHYMNLGDELILITRKNCYLFEIDNIDIVSEREIDILNKSYDDKTLTLITCMKDNKYRLILIARLKKIA